MAMEKKGANVLSKRAAGPLAKQAPLVTVGSLERALLKEFPAEDAEKWDRTGLVAGDPSQLVTGVAVALDPTVPAIEQARAAGANVLVTHHPPFLSAPGEFSPAPSVAVNAGAGVWAAVENGVALMCFHTALDVSAAAQKVLPGMLGLGLKGVLLPLAGSRRKGYGQVCAVQAEDAPLTLGQLAARCTSMFARQPRVWGSFSRVVERVVTCTGSAGDVPAAALQTQADCLICGEIKYHDALAFSQAGFAIVELGHDTSELPLVAPLAAAVRRAGVPEEAVVRIDQSDNWAYPESTRV